MTTTSDQLSPGDQRRALSLMVHTIRRDLVGINTVLEETNDLERSAQLIVALCNVVPLHTMHTFHTPTEDDGA